MFRWWRGRFTVGGQALSVALLVCLPNTFHQGSAAVPLVAAMVSLLIMGTLGNRFFRPRLGARLLGAPILLRGEAALLSVKMQNVSRLPVGSIRVRLTTTPRWSDASLPRRVSLVDAADSEIVVPIVARERGIFPAPTLTVESSFPLELVRTTWRLTVEGEVAVAPHYRPFTASDFAALGLSWLDIYAEAVHRPGNQGDYVGSREHLPGTPVRRWDYPSWARLQRPIAREYEELHQGRVALVIDTFAPPAALEDLLSLAAALGHALFAAGVEVSLFTPTNQRAAADRMADQQDLLLALAAVATGDERPQTFAADVRRHDWSSTLAIVLLADEAGDQHCLCAAIEEVGGRAIPILATQDAGQIVGVSDFGMPTLRTPHQTVLP